MRSFPRAGLGARLPTVTEAAERDSVAGDCCVWVALSAPRGGLCVFRGSPRSLAPERRGRLTQCVGFCVAAVPCPASACWGERPPVGSLPPPRPGVCLEPGSFCLFRGWSAGLSACRPTSPIADSSGENPGGQRAYRSDQTPSRDRG